MTEKEHQQYVTDLSEAVNQMEFRVHLGDAIAVRMRREFWLISAIFWLSGLIAALLLDWWWLP